MREIFPLSAYIILPFLCCVPVRTGHGADEAANGNIISLSYPDSTGAESSPRGSSCCHNDSRYAFSQVMTIFRSGAAIRIHQAYIETNHTIHHRRHPVVLYTQSD